MMTVAGVDQLDAGNAFRVVRQGVDVDDARRPDERKRQRRAPERTSGHP